MLVKDIMTKKVTFVSPDDLVTDVAHVFYKSGFHGLPVVEGGRLIGIVTENDFFLKNYDDLYLPSYISFLRSSRVIDALPKNIKGKIDTLMKARVRDMMSSPCQSVSSNGSISELTRLIKKTKFKSWPVVDSNNNLIGIVTLADLLGIFKRGAKEMSRAYKKQLNKNRKIDADARDIKNFWERSFVFIKKTHVRTWKGVFIIAFIAGVAAALIWSISIHIEVR